MTFPSLISFFVEEQPCKLFCLYIAKCHSVVYFYVQTCKNFWSQISEFKSIQDERVSVMPGNKTRFSWELTI